MIDELGRPALPKGWRYRDRKKQPLPEFGPVSWLTRASGVLDEADGAAHICTSIDGARCAFSGSLRWIVERDYEPAATEQPALERLARTPILTAADRVRLIYTGAIRLRSTLSVPVGPGMVRPMTAQEAVIAASKILEEAEKGEGHDRT